MSDAEVESNTDVYTDVSDSLASLNQCLGALGETPISKPISCTKPNTKKDYMENNIITTVMKTTVLGDVQSEDAGEGEMIAQLKSYMLCKSTNFNCRKSWSRRKVQSVFGVSDYIARVVDREASRSLAHRSLHLRLDNPASPLLMEMTKTTCYCFRR